jgi:DNA-binding transcriptional ArsR family regulator
MDDKTFRKPVFIIEDLETLRIVSDSMRLEILEVLDIEPQTINQVAEKLGLSSSRLYYHFNQLESHGLIKVVETRIHNNIIEKIYWLSAEEIDIDKKLLDISSESGPENLSRFVTNTLEAARSDILRSIQARKFNIDRGAKSIPRDMVIMNMKKRLKDETYKKFLDRFRELMDEFSNLPEADATDEDNNLFGLNCFVYPSYYYPDEKEDQIS